MATYVFNSEGHIPMSEISGSHGNPMFNSLGNCQSGFQSGLGILHSNQQCMQIPMSPHPHYLFSIFKILDFLGHERYLFVVLICVSLVTNDVEHLYICLLVIYLF